MAEECRQVQIEKLPLSKDRLDGPALAALRDYETQDPQFGIDWLCNMAATALSDDEEAVMYVARRSGEDFILCPMKVNSRSGDAQSLSTFYTTSYSPVVASPRPEGLFTALFEYFARHERFATLTFTAMDNNSPAYGIVRRSLVQAGWKGIHGFFCFGNWIHDLEQNSYQSYFATLPSRLRNTVARRTRRFLAEDRGTLDLVTDGEMLESAIGHFVAIYNASWKQSEPYPDFIPRLLRMSARRGWLRLGIARYDDMPVASQIWLVCGGTAYIFKLAYHQDYGQYSPGTVLTAFMMEYVIDKDTVNRIDYLSGDDSYKRDWMSTRRERHGIAGYNTRRVRGMTLLLGRAAKRLLKTLYRTPAIVKPADTKEN